MSMMDKILYAERMVPAGLRREMRWRMSEATARQLAAQAGVPLDGEDPLAGLTMFGIPVELVDSDEVLLAIKVV